MQLTKNEPVRRSRRGSAIAEMGPALFLLLIIIFFPMVDLLEMGAAYMMSAIFHDYMIRELALSAPPVNALPPPPGQSAQTPDSSIQTQAQAISKITTNFQSSVFFNFLKMKNSDLKVSNITYIPNTVTNSAVVQCTTSVTVDPFINIPYWNAVPGINAPVTFSITSQRPQEELGYN